MKKARIMLTAIGVLAVVGSALAFKVRTTESLYCSHPIDRICKVQVFEIKTTLAPAGKNWECTTAAAPLTTTCPAIRVTQGL